MQSDFKQRSSDVAHPNPLRVDADEDRKPRSVEEMVKEADFLKGFFQEK